MTPCTAGSYCAVAGAAAPTRMCQPGYYCPTGSWKWTICTGGYAFFLCVRIEWIIYLILLLVCRIQLVVRLHQSFDTRGTVHARLLLLARLDQQHSGSGSRIWAFDTITSHDVLSSQMPCMAGFFCPTGSSDQTLCPIGYYCPALSPAAIICPIGTFCNTVGQWATTPCTNGTYCSSSGLSVPTASCQGGYYCANAGIGTLGASSATSAPCLAGYYCPPGASAPVPCPLGFVFFHSVFVVFYFAAVFSRIVFFYLLPWSLHSHSVLTLSGLAFSFFSFCLRHSTYCAASGLTAGSVCLAGTYCGTTGIAVSTGTGTCQVGYYCLAGSYLATQAQCKTGFYCLSGSSAQTPCAGGQACTTAGLQTATNTACTQVSFFL